MIISTIKVFANTSNISEIVEVLSSVKGQVEGKTGCVSCLILQEIDNDRNIIYEEKWKTQEQLNNHISSDLYRNILAVLDMSYRLPTVEFSTVSTIKGMEVIKVARRYHEV